MNAIEQIDRLIDANRAAMIRRLRFDPGMSSVQWQRAWDRCPDLWTCERDLFRQRDIARQARDKQINKEWKRQQRQARRQSNTATV